MMRFVAKSKLHGLRLTETNLNYEGSITLDPELLAAADILPGERVQIVNLSSGARIETYVIEGQTGSGACALNGPAARTGEVGDMVHVIAYALADAADDIRGLPRTVHVDEENRLRQ